MIKNLRADLFFCLLTKALFLHAAYVFFLFSFSLFENLLPVGTILNFGKHTHSQIFFDDENLVLQFLRIGL